MPESSTVNLDDWRSISRLWEARAKQSRKQLDKISAQLEIVQYALKRKDLDKATAIIGSLIVETQETPN